MESQESTRPHQSSIRAAVDSPGDFDGDIAAYHSTRVSATSNARIRFWSILLSDSIVIVGSFILALIFSSVVRELLDIAPHTLIIPSSNLLAFAVFVLPVVLILGKSFLSGHYTQPKNVLTGDMSLVGPRPIVVAEKSYYGGSYSYYEDSKPGITGLWQISGRNDIAYSERVDMDVAYSRNWSLWLDIVIILKTVPTILGRNGAY